MAQAKPHLMEANMMAICTVTPVAAHPCLIMTPDVIAIKWTLGLPCCKYLKQSGIEVSMSELCDLIIMFYECILVKGCWSEEVCFRKAAAVINRKVGALSSTLSASHAHKCSDICHNMPFVHTCIHGRSVHNELLSTSSCRI